MKLVNLLWDNTPLECLLLSTYEDVLEYQQLLANNTSNTFSYVLNRSIPIDRWDHYGFDGNFGNSFNMTIHKAKLFGGRPILMFDGVTNEKCVAILKAIQSGEQVVVKRNGGWCTVMEDLHKILEVSEFTGSSAKKSVINKNTTYLNLENDPELEKRTKEYLTKDPNFSYVLCLREFTDKQLKNVFAEFLYNGGKIVYVYTTGSDTVQMWEYCKQIVESGIKQVEFEFNSGIEEEHNLIIDYLRSKNVNVEIV